MKYLIEYIKDLIQDCKIMYLVLTLIMFIILTAAIISGDIAGYIAFFTMLFGIISISIMHINENIGISVLYKYGLKKFNIFLNSFYDMYSKKNLKTTYYVSKKLYNLYKLEFNHSSIYKKIKLDNDRQNFSYGTTKLSDLIDKPNKFFEI
jgi:hypothetical protein